MLHHCPVFTVSSRYWEHFCIVLIHLVATECFSWVHSSFLERSCCNIKFKDYIHQIWFLSSFTPQFPKLISSNDLIISFLKWDSDKEPFSILSHLYDNYLQGLLFLNTKFYLQISIKWFTKLKWSLKFVHLYAKMNY